MKRLVRPEVPNELADAFRWYQERGAGLGHEFLEAVEATLSVIEEHPRFYL